MLPFFMAGTTDLKLLFMINAFWPYFIVASFRLKADVLFDSVIDKKVDGTII